MRLRLTRFSISLLGSKEKLPTYSIASFLIQMHLTASAIEETLTFCNLIGTRSNQSVDRCWKERFRWKWALGPLVGFIFSL